MNPSQAISKDQLYINDSVTGAIEGITYKAGYFDTVLNKQVNDCMMYLQRKGAQYQILCYVNGRLSHSVDSSFDYKAILTEWEKLKRKTLYIINKN